jgi:hypothetical protein
MSLAIRRRAEQVGAFRIRPSASRACRRAASKRDRFPDLLPLTRGTVPGAGAAFAHVEQPSEGRNLRVSGHDACRSRT